MKNKLIKIEACINRLKMQKAALEYKEKKRKEKIRKSRTRTLIQLGGLLELTVFPTICNIELGEDLQLEMREKAALLLGILVDCAENLPENLSEKEIRRKKIIGNTILTSRYLKQ